MELFADIKNSITSLFQNKTFFIGVCTGVAISVIRRYAISQRTELDETELTECASITEINVNFDDWKSDLESESSADYRMVFFVRTDLGMKAGKIAAQCSHAILGAVENVYAHQNEAMKLWYQTFQKKDFYAVNSLNELIDITRRAKSLGLKPCVVQDAGRTQIAPGSKTVMAVGPIHKSTVQSLVVGLKKLDQVKIKR